MNQLASCSRQHNRLHCIGYDLLVWISILNNVWLKLRDLVAVKFLELWVVPLKSSETFLEKCRFSVADPKEEFVGLPVELPLRVVSLEIERRSCPQPL